MHDHHDAHVHLAAHILFSCIYVAVHHCRDIHVPAVTTLRSDQSRKLAGSKFFTSKRSLSQNQVPVTCEQIQLSILLTDTQTLALTCTRLLGRKA